jgi:predicted cupin superfamily sugar epimerase
VTDFSLTPQKIIDLLGLRPLTVEGGFYRRTYYAPEALPAGSLPSRYPAADRPFASAIYFLLTSDRDSFSALHRLPTDEIYHFYLGDPVEMLQLLDDGSSRHIHLGQDILNGQQVQFIAKKGIWQGSYLLPGGAFALLGTTMAPAFEDSDFEVASRMDLLQTFPHEQALITRLTRG